MSKGFNKTSRRSFLATGATLVAATSAGIAPALASEPGTSPLPAGAGVSLLADSARKVGLDPMKLSMTHDIKPMIPVSDAIFGPAVTTKWEVGRQRGTGEDIKEHMFHPLDQAAKGSIWVIESGTDRLLSMFGGLIGLGCKRHGLAGAVTDNGCRDIAEFRDADFPVFAKASVPFGPGDFIRPVGANVPIVCGGVAVNPGDWVAADLDGVLVIPKDRVPEVIEAAIELLAKEDNVRREIESGATLAKAYKL